MAGYIHDKTRLIARLKQAKEDAIKIYNVMEKQLAEIEQRVAICLPEEPPQFPPAFIANPDTSGTRPDVYATYTTSSDNK